MNLREMEAVEKLFGFVKDKLMCSSTNLIYDHSISGGADDFPNADDCKKSFPNPCGWGTGMEDSMLAGGTMLEACVDLRESLDNADDFIKKTADGMLRCSEAALSEGFIPRSVCMSDGRSHYVDSSRDQYTLFIYGLHKYLRSGICSCDDRARIKRAAEAVARRANKNVTRENGYDMLRDDGEKSIATVMWGNLENHEFMRLAMIYLFAYEAGGDKKWLFEYEKIFYKSIENSLPMKSYWHLYAIHQMQASLRLCYESDTDPVRKKLIADVMNTAAEYVVGQAGKIALKDGREPYNKKQLPFRECETEVQQSFKSMGIDCVSPIRPDMNDYFTLLDCADIIISVYLAPNGKEIITDNAIDLFWSAYEKLDFLKHDRNLPVYFLNALSKIRKL